MLDQSTPVTLTYRPDGKGEFTTVNLPGQLVSFNGDNYLAVNFGDWKGCFNFSGHITVTTVVKMDQPPTTPPPTPPKTPPKTPVTPAAPTSLPNTGAGNIAAVAGGATILGATLYRRRLLRSLTK